LKKKCYWEKKFRAVEKIQDDVTFGRKLKNQKK